MMMERFLPNLLKNIARFDYDNQRVIEQIKRDIAAMSKWADVAVSVIGISED